MTSRGGGDPNNSMASMPSAEWARRLGASPSKRMTASWSGSNTDPTEYKVAARCFAPNGGLPSGRSHRELDIQIPIQGFVRDAPVRAVLTAFDMPAQRRRSATLDRRHELELAEAHSRARVRRIATSFSRPTCSMYCVNGGAPRARRDGCIPVSPGCSPATVDSA